MQRWQCLIYNCTQETGYRNKNIESKFILDQTKLLRDCFKWGITIIAWRVTRKNAYSPFILKIMKWKPFKCFRYQEIKTISEIDQLIIQSTNQSINRPYISRLLEEHREPLNLPQDDDAQDDDAGKSLSLKS